MKVYHNARCSKSRSTCALLEEEGVEFEVIEYLKTPPTAKELRELLVLLGFKAHDLVRKTEAIYKSDYKGKDLTKAEWIEAMVKHPVLIERPIVVNGDRAVIGRPPDNVKKIL